VAASKQTVAQAVEVIHKWCEENGVFPSDMRVLVDDLRRTGGNKSWQDTLSLVSRALGEIEDNAARP